MVTISKPEGLESLTNKAISKSLFHNTCSKMAN
ncbi:hypothetical protein Goklo_003161 [Gossypium klotzschianum]|uniref:Uncharacterized protein n=1 Tax=Gossypium klotzschianum TaxID=34286 RepID=A0A7J8VWH6_9ROSI|nr:hypothetical protein [Gossypium klotzschianum]